MLVILVGLMTSFVLVDAVKSQRWPEVASTLALILLATLGMWLSLKRDAELQMLCIHDRAMAAACNGIAIADARQPDHPLIYVNDAFCTVTGYHREDILGKNCRFLQGEDRDQPCLKKIRQALGQGTEARALVRNYRKDGTLFWNELYIAPVRDRRGRLTHFVGIQNDITRLMEAEVAQRASETRLRAIIDNADAFVCVKDLAGRYELFSRYALEVYGRTAEELIGRTDEELFSPTRVQRYRQSDEEVVRTGTQLHLEEDILIDGYRFCLQTVKFPLLDAENSICAIASVGTDVTAYHLALEATRARCLLLSILADIGRVLTEHSEPQAMLDGCCMVCTSHLQAVRTCIWMHDETEDLLIMRACADRDPSATHRQRRLRPGQGPIGQIAQTRMPYYESPLDLDAWDGVAEWLHHRSITSFVGQPLLDGDRLLGVLTVFSEDAIQPEVQETIQTVAGQISLGILRLETAASLRHAKEHTEAANRAKSAFLANMSHEIRTPLNAVLGYAQLLQHDEQLPERHAEHVEVIARSGEHLLALIDDVLEVSRIGAGRVTVSQSTIDMPRLLEDLAAMFLMRAREKGLAFHVESAPDMPRCLRTDAAKLRQILVNLLGNAIKFTSSGSVTLKVRCEQMADGIFYLEGRVSDTGIGIPAHALSRIFHEFEHNVSGLDDPGGTGLGLTICQRYVDMLGGSLEVDSVEGHGSIFLFRIPVDIVEVMRPSLHTAAPSTPNAKLKPSRAGDSQYLLIVDDSRDNRLLLCRILKQWHYQCEEAVNGEQAIKMVRKRPPDLILMDMAMPVMDGETATRRLRELGYSLPILAVTASVYEEDCQRFMNSGVDQVITKPFRNQELLKMVERHLQTPTMVMARPSRSAAGLPRELLHALQKAVYSGYMDSFDELLQTVSETHPDLSRQLHELARRFEYDAIQNLLSKKD